MGASTGNTSPRRVGMRAIAEAAGVCLMTVSLSLRDSPSISAATRKRIRTIADELGYRPDPEIARLMGRLRSSRVTQHSVVIAMLDLQSEKATDEHPYIARLRKGIEKQVDHLGYGSTLLRLRDYGGSTAKLMRVIRNRGIVGCILMPSNEPVRLDKRVKWDGISVVAATSSVLAPRFHGVVPNHIHNSMALVDDVYRRGYRKIGTILTESMEERTAHHYSLTMTWHGHRERILILPDDASPEEDEQHIVEWLKKHEVDIIFAQDAEIVSRAIRYTSLGEGRVGLISLSTIAQDGIAYQDERPEYIGESAVSLLAGMMHNNETGIPVHPRVTTVDGEFRDDRSVTRLRPAGTTRKTAKKRA